MSLYFRPAFERCTEAMKQTRGRLLHRLVLFRPLKLPLARDRECILERAESVSGALAMDGIRCLSNSTVVNAESVEAKDTNERADSHVSPLDVRGPAARLQFRAPGVQKTPPRGVEKGALRKGTIAERGGAGLTGGGGRG